FRTVFENIADDVFQEIFCQVYIVLQVIEGYFRLHHPELSQVTCSIRVLGTECRPEGVHPAQSHSCSFCFKLARNGKVGFLSEKILSIVYFTFLISWNIVEVEIGNPEHLTGTFVICACDDRSIDVEEMVFIVEFVNGKTYGTSDPEHS